MLVPRHDPGCAKSIDPFHDDGCTCGLDAMAEAMASLKGPTMASTHENSNIENDPDCAHCALVREGEQIGLDDPYDHNLSLCTFHWGRLSGIEHAEQRIVGIIEDMKSEAERDAGMVPSHSKEWLELRERIDACDDLLAAIKERPGRA